MKSIILGGSPLQSGQACGLISEKENFLIRATDFQELSTQAWVGFIGEGLLARGLFPRWPFCSQSPISIYHFSIQSTINKSFGVIFQHTLQSLLSSEQPLKTGWAYRMLYKNDRYLSTFIIFKINIDKNFLAIHHFQVPDN